MSTSTPTILHKVFTVNNIQSHIPLILDLTLHNYDAWRGLFLTHCMANDAKEHIDDTYDALMNGAILSPYMLPNLTGLEFESCYDLRELPSEICNLVHLQNLNITNCHELAALPKRLGSLSNLGIMNLHCCTKLQDLPKSIGSLRKLSFLDIFDCLSISQLPEQIGELCVLRMLKMGGVHGLHELPESMSKMSWLDEVICDEETSYLWMDFESDLYNLRINVVEDDRFGSFLKIVQ